jgi:thymidine kinase
MAKLYFRYAVMNAGKSTQLLQIAYDYEKNNGRRALVIKPGNDTKEGEYLISRLENGQIRRKSDFLIDVGGGPGWLYSAIEAEMKKNRVAIVLIDEAQFLSRDNVWDLCRVITYLDIPVICFGLKVDAFGNPFEGSSYLFALAQDIEEVTTRAICRLSKKPRKATIHLRMVNGKPVFAGAQVAIENDADIRYLPVCLQEYIQLKDGKAEIDPALLHGCGND